MEKEKICGIYKITNPKNKIYIGRSVNVIERWNKYKRYDCEKQILLYRSLCKHGMDKHKFEIVCLSDRSELDKLEKYYIELYQCFNSKYGLNLTVGGTKNTMLGKKHSEETKKKMSLSKIGNSSMTGMHHSEETKLKMSKSAYGNKNAYGSKLSDEHKRKFTQSGSDALAVKVIDLSTGILYKNITEASKIFNIKRSSLYDMLSSKKTKQNTTTLRRIN